MTARMNNPGKVLPESLKGIQSIIGAANSAGVPSATMELAHLRASQVNGCSPCVYSGAISAKKAGESDERLFAVAAWRETDLFTDAERAALALSESMTRLADRPESGHRPAHRRQQPFRAHPRPRQRRRNSRACPALERND